MNVSRYMVLAASTLGLALGPAVGFAGDPQSTTTHDQSSSSVQSQQRSQRHSEQQSSMTQRDRERAADRAVAPGEQDSAEVRAPSAQDSATPAQPSSSGQLSSRSTVETHESTRRTSTERTMPSTPAASPSGSASEMNAPELQRGGGPMDDTSAAPLSNDSTSLERGDDVEALHGSNTAAPGASASDRDKHPRQRSVPDRTQTSQSIK